MAAHLLDLPPGGAPDSGLVTPPSRDTSPHPDAWYDTRYRRTGYNLDLSPSFLTVNNVLQTIHVPHPVRGIICDNLSGCVLRVNDSDFIPPNTLGFVRPIAPDTDRFTIVAIAGSLPSSMPVWIVFTEAPVNPTTGIYLGTGVAAANMAGGQLLVSNTGATQIRPARPGRTRLLIKSLDGINNISLYGSDGVLSMVLRPNESVEYRSIGTVSGIVAASGGANPNIAYWDEYNY